MVFILRCLAIAVAVILITAEAVRDVPLKARDVAVSHGKRFLRSEAAAVDEAQDYTEFAPPPPTMEVVRAPTSDPEFAPPPLKRVLEGAHGDATENPEFAPAP
ncbi:Aste57867_8318 [Aphanomyces stellatus]|uniref:Aste57867_8318 protein n=1 Tax=Aphanomyces stellatus TaxID=120398 RepID=A0A485KJZ4_9STRA|nr:hypothetical protein As57867_008286 [Aphanomyces stellatus]VFT85205.1 Aste57867_8318 [Aphanomyces stellatus]